MEQWLLEYQQNINTAIGQFFKEHYSWTVGHNEQILREAVLYTVMHEENSRTHTILAMLAYEEFLWITAESVVNVLIGVDFLHIWLLLHADAAAVRNIYVLDGLPTVKKYGTPLSIVVGDILIELGMDRLSQAGNMQVIREALTSTGDSGYLRWIARDILTDHSVISEREYLTMFDEKLARGIISAFLMGSMIAWDASQLLKDQYRQFGTFLARIYQVGYDINFHEQSLQNSWIEMQRERWVVDFLWYEKAQWLYDELYIELMKMTSAFQNPKFNDIITIFKDRSIRDI